MALSRCRRLSGLYLKNPLRKETIKVDDAVVAFSMQKTPDALIGKQIEWGKAEKLYKESREALWQNKPEEMLSNFDKAIKIRDDRDTDDFRRYIKTLLDFFHFKRKQSQKLFEEIIKFRSKETKWLDKEAEMESNARMLSSELQSEKRANSDLSEEYRSMCKACENLRKESAKLKKEIKRVQSKLQSEEKTNSDLSEKYRSMCTACEEMRKETVELKKEIGGVQSELQSEKRANSDLSEKYHGMCKACEDERKECVELKKEIERVQSIKWYQKLLGKK